MEKHTGKQEEHEVHQGLECFTKKTKLAPKKGEVEGNKYWVHAPGKGQTTEEEGKTVKDDEEAERKKE